MSLAGHLYHEASCGKFVSLIHSTKFRYSSSIIQQRNPVVELCWNCPSHMKAIFIRSPNWLIP